MAHPALLLLATAALLLAGCTAPLYAARIPPRLLQGSQGNGWAQDGAHSDGQPASEQGGLVQRQTLAYKDEAQGSNNGFPASLVLTTLRLTPMPTEQSLRDLLSQQVQQRSAEQGIALGAQQVQDGRTLADGHRTLYFVFTGTVSNPGPLFTNQDAGAKIVGEVWNCPESGTSIAAVGLAQVTSVQKVGGVTVTQQRDSRNWNEIVADPSGSVDGIAGADGLVYDAQCKP